MIDCSPYTMKAEYLAAVSFAPDGGVVVAVVEIHHDAAR